MEKKTRAPAGNPQPRKYSSAAKSPTITHRVRGGLYERLKASAEQRGVSLSEEIERRLETSFRSASDPYIDTAFMMAEANCDVIQKLLGKNIAEDPFTRSACAKAAATAVELVGGLAGQETPETRALLQVDAEAFGQVVGMFTKALLDGAPEDATSGLKRMIEAMTEQRRSEIEDSKRRQSMLLARLLREGAPAQPEPTTEE